MAYYTVFGILLCGLCFPLIQDKRVRRPFIWSYFIFVLIVLTLFSGLRSPYLDPDYLNYVDWFNEIRFGIIHEQIWLKDPAYAAIAIAVASAGFTYLLIPLIYAFIALTAKVVLAYTVACEQAVTLYFYLIFCRFYLLLEMTQIRAAVAIPVMTLAIYFACTQRPAKAALFYLIALSFHLSVAIGLPLFILILCGVRFRSRKWVFMFAPLAVCASLVFEAFLKQLYGVYRIADYVAGQSEEETLSLLSFHLLLHVAIVLIVVFFCWKKLSLFERAAAVYSGFAIFLYSIFIGETVLATRFEQLFDLMFLALFVVIFKRLSSRWHFVYLSGVGILGFILFQSTIGIVKSYAFWDALH